MKSITIALLLLASCVTPNEAMFIRRRSVALDNSVTLSNVQQPSDDDVVVLGRETYSNESEHNGTEDHEDERFKIASINFERVSGPLIITLWLLLICVIKLLFHSSKHLSETVPESCVLMLLGLAMGAILFASGIQNYELHPDVFFLILLPPIILDAGYHMPNRAFFDNIGSILLFAIVGTLVNTLLIGYSLWGVTKAVGLTLDMPSLHCLTLAALLSAVDPVAVIAVFEEIHVHDVLYIVVFGESLLNDGVAVVLFHVFEGFSEIGQENIIGIDILFSFISFFVVAGGAILIGIIHGIFAAFITRFTSNMRIVEPLIVFIIGYLAYIVAELFHLSGILSCTFCGIVMSKYVNANVSVKSRTTIKFTLKMLANVCEGVIFLFLGISAVSRNHQWNTAFVLSAIVFCLVYRAIVVWGFCLLLNPYRADRLSLRDQFIMAYSGLRGGIAFFLAMSLSCDIFPDCKLFFTTTVFVVYFTVILLGTTVKPIVNCLKVRKKTESKLNMNEKIFNRSMDHLMSGIEDIACNYGHNRLRSKYANFDRKILKKVLMRDANMKREGAGIVSVFHDLAEEDLYALVEHGDSTFTPVSGVEIIVPASSTYSHPLTPAMDRKISTITNSTMGALDALPAADKPQLYESLPSLIISPPDVIIDDSPAGEGGASKTPSVSVSPLPSPGAITRPSIGSSIGIGSGTKPSRSARSSMKMSKEDLHEALDDGLYRPRRRFVMLSTDKEPVEADSQPVYQHELRRHIRQSLSVAPLDSELRRRMSMASQKPQFYLSPTTTPAAERKRRVTVMEQSMGTTTSTSGDPNAPVRKTSRIVVFTPSPKPRARRLGNSNMAFVADDDNRDDNVFLSSETINNVAVAIDEDPSGARKFLMPSKADKWKRRVDNRKLTPDSAVTRSAAEAAVKMRRSVSDACIQLDKRQQVKFSGITETSEDAAVEAADTTSPLEQVVQTGNPQQVEQTTSPVEDASREVTQTQHVALHVKSASAPSSPQHKLSVVSFPPPPTSDDPAANLTGFKRLT